MNDTPGDESQRAAYWARFSGQAGERIALLAAVLVAVPTLFTGIFADDYFHLIDIDGRSPLHGLIRIFQFSGLTTPENQRLLDMGVLPWFSSLDFHVRFFRPLAAWLMRADWQLFGYRYPLYHLHSAAWYLAFVWLASRLFRRTGMVLAPIALLLFAVDDAHFVPAAWWSNRHALVSAVFALAGLLAHLRWREQQWRPGLPLALIAWALGLIAGETAVGAFGFIVAYEAFARDDAYAARIRALIPAGLLALAYAAYYKYAAYGVHGSSVYLDPIGDWPNFLANAPERALLLFGQQFYSLPVESALGSRAARAAMIVCSLLGCALLVPLIRQAWNGLDAVERRETRWLAIGGALSAVPALATFASGRLLSLPSLAGALLVAILLRDAWRRMPRVRIGKALFAGIVWIHVVSAAAFWLVAGLGLHKFDELLMNSALQTETDLKLLDKTNVIVVQASDPFVGMYPALHLAVGGHPVPASWWTLAMAPCDYRLKRTAPNAFELEMRNGEILGTDMEWLLRSGDTPLKAGDTVRAGGMTVTVHEIGRRGPRRFTCSFEQPLEDPRYAILRWDRGALRRFPLPPVGQSVAWQHSPGCLDGRFYYSKSPATAMP